MSLTLNPSSGMIGIACASKDILSSTINYPTYPEDSCLPWICSPTYLCTLALTFLISKYNKKQDYVHLELIFLAKEKTENCIAFGVFSREGLKRMERSFSNDNYHYIWLSATEKQLNTLYKKCMSYLSMDNKVEFDNQTAWRLLCWPQEQVPRNLKTCHSFIMDSLHTISIMENYRINVLTIDEIVGFLSNMKSRQVAALSPYVQSRKYSIKQSK